MAACESLQHIHKPPLPLKNHQKSLEVSVCFGDDSSSSLSPLSSPSFSPSSFSSSPFSSSSSCSPFPINFDHPKVPRHFDHRRGRRRFFMSSESLSICTENLGLESCEDVEISAINNNNNDYERRVFSRRHIKRYKSNEFLFDSKHTFNAYLSNGEPRISRITGEEMPPPISSIARNGKPWVSFKSFRNNGRFVLREVRVPIQELVHSRREDGRLKLQYIQSDEETMDEETMDEETVDE
ncbi:hypothetical protein POM88_020728 [Heracleum sosnowskyi]|uniref:FAF domain-containing protein n=1 Tax=Heracleum sosnowskyi TaxID=360622 RepID=A0AAD8IEM0_9APIA|nr:hypothetical protein POM88_020728 [Heracleum sosnowskyi]